MPNTQNLKPQAHKLTVEEQSAGGKASGAARREKKRMREVLEELLARDYHDRSGNTHDGTTVLMTKTFQMAMDGDMRALEFIRDVTGQKPADKVEIDTIDPQARSEMDELLGLND